MIFQDSPNESHEYIVLKFYYLEDFEITKILLGNPEIQDYLQQVYAVQMIYGGKEVIFPSLTDHRCIYITHYNRQLETQMKNYIKKLFNDEDVYYLQEL